MYSSSTFPLDIDALLASMFELLKERGAAREIAILASSEARGEQYRYDNWNGGTYTWNLVLSIELPLFSRLKNEEREEAAGILGEVVAPFFAEFSNDHFGGVQLVPQLVTNQRWRTDAAEYLSGSGITNQGRVRSDNLASRSCDGLLFRSEAEIHLYRALKSLGVAFAPLPVFLRGGREYSRIEPDFVVIKGGVVLVVEVDGDTYHRESPADAHIRLAPLVHEGVHVERVRASECGTAETARACAGRIVAILNKHIDPRGR